MSVRQAIWLAVMFGVLIWSGINPKDQITWLLEVLPVLIALPVLYLTREKFPLTTLAYVLAFSLIAYFLLKTREVAA